MDTKCFLLCLGVLAGCSSSDDGTTPQGIGTNGAGGFMTSIGGNGVLGGGENGVLGGGGNGVLGGGGSYAGAGGNVVGVSSGGSGVGAVGVGGVVGVGGAISSANGGTTTTSSGGAVASGGATATGSGGSTAGGPTPSNGCGTTAPATGSLTIDVAGTSRQYILALPASYDPKTPYRLIFAWHGLGGTAAQVASSWYGLKSPSAGSAIFVAGQGLPTSTPVGDGAGWPNTNGQDVAFVKALYAQLQGQLCIDQSRVFSVGMSYGGIMSDTLGCQMGAVFRAIAPMSGSGPGYGGRGAKCVGQVAVWMSNGDNDTIVPTAQERASRDFWVGANHCQTTGAPTDPSPCVAYPGCDAGNPVTWCEFAGGHTIPSFAPAAIWKFFAQF